MSKLILVEDREKFRELFDELIKSYLESSLEVIKYRFEDFSDTEIFKSVDTFLFNISINIFEKHQLIQSWVSSGYLENKRVIICSSYLPPPIKSEGNVEIFYCCEDKFTKECIPYLINASNLESTTYSS